MTIKELFSESPNSSLMRVMCFIALLAAIAIAFYGMHKGYALKDITWLSGSFITGAFGGKTWQKKTEIQKNGK